MTSHRWLTSPSLSGAALLAAAAVPASVCAATYATADDVAHRAFKTATAFGEVLVALAPADAAALAAPGAAPHGPLRTIEARQGDAVLGRVVVDSVVGKFEQIDYAVALDSSGKVLAVEILTYREGHGGEVRMPSWRAQFVGKTAADALHVGADIANISGATLSCTHVTDGVHRIVAWAAKHPLAAKAA
ncbi:MAG: FMN-binding protein [Burkholderiales bacterium]|jgi:Na+-transporting NADH:ubiquinone oxidoreductase subunit C|nr:FMN-binding protein [Burkholderiales bacterium]